MDKRSIYQNSLFHDLCSLASEHAKFAGKVRTKDEWKVLFISAHSHSIGQQGCVIMGLEGEVVSLRESSARMSKERMTSLIEYTLAYMAMNEIPTGAQDERKE